MSAVADTQERRSFAGDIATLFVTLSSKRKWQLALLFVLQSASALSEVLSLGAIVPFLTALTNAQILLKNEWLGPWLESLEVTDSHHLIMLMAGLFAAAMVLANILRFTTLWAQVHIGAAIGTDLGARLFENTLYRSYPFFLKNNSSQIISNVTNDLSGAMGVLQGVLMIITQGMITLFLAASLVLYDSLIAASVFASVLLAYGTITLVIKRRLYTNSQIISDRYASMVKALQEGFGGIRYISLHHTQSVFVEQYRHSDHAFRRAAADNSVLRQAPRYLIEAVGIVAICIISIFAAKKYSNLAEVVPFLGFLAMAAYRLMPAVQQVYASLSSILGLKVALHKTISLLVRKPPPYYAMQNASPLYLCDELRFDDVWFRYHDEGQAESWTLAGLDFSIKAKTTVAFVGHTGSGKSTLSDLILGLLQPQRGRLLVDGTEMNASNRIAWQKGIAHVPQHIYLTDSSIAENIAFGVTPDQIDMGRVAEAARRAQIDGFIQTLPNQYREMVGERGVRLSGGQLQRIGIARALYLNPSLVIFDEATSALDNNTEKDVMRALEDLGGELTVIMIAHRLSTVQRADNIFVLDHGRQVAEGTYADLMQSSDHFRKLAKGSDQQAA